MFEVLLAILSVYGLSILVSEYDGPFNVLGSVRGRLSAFECAVCASVYLALPVVLFLGFFEYLAVLGGAIFLIRTAESMA